MSNICTAAYKGDLAELKRLVAAGENLRQQDHNGSPLENAALGGHLDVIKWLVEEQGFSLDDRVKKRIATPFAQIQDENDKTTVQIQIRYFKDTGVYQLVCDDMLRLKSDGTLATDEELRLKYITIFIDQRIDGDRPHRESDIGDGILTTVLNSAITSPPYKGSKLVCEATELKKGAGITVAWAMINPEYKAFRNKKNPSSQELKIIYKTMVEILRQNLKQYQNVVLTEIETTTSEIISEPIVPMNSVSSKATNDSELYFPTLSEIALKHRGIRALDYLDSQGYKFKHGDMAIALSNRNGDQVRFLAEHNCPYNGSAEDIHNAIAHNQLQILKILIQHGYCTLTPVISRSFYTLPDFSFGRGCTRNAAMLGLVEILKWLVDEMKAGLEPDLIKSVISAKNPNWIYIIKFLVDEHGYFLSTQTGEEIVDDVISPYRAGNYADKILLLSWLLDGTTYFPDEERLEKIFRWILDVSKENKSPEASKSQEKTLVWMLNQKRFILTDALGRQEVLRACESGLIHYLKALINKNKKLLNVRNSSGMSLPFVAAQNGTLEVLKYLVEEQDCSVEDKDKFPHGVLQYFPMNIITYLVNEHGFKLTREIISQRIGTIELVWLVDIMKINIDGSSIDGEPLLCGVAQAAYRQENAIQFLIARGANVHEKLKDGSSVLESMRNVKTIAAQTVLKISSDYADAFKNITFPVPGKELYEKLDFIAAANETKNIMSLLKLMGSGTNRNKIFEISLKAPGFLANKFKDTKLLFSTEEIEHIHHLIIIMDGLNAKKPGTVNFTTGKENYRYYLIHPVELLKRLDQLNETNAIEVCLAATGLPRTLLRDHDYKEALKPLELKNEVFYTTLKIIKNSGVHSQKVMQAATCLHEAQQTIYANLYQDPASVADESINNLLIKEREYIARRPKLSAYYMALKSQFQQALFAAVAIEKQATDDEAIRMLILLAQQVRGVKTLVKILGAESSPADLMQSIKKISKIVGETSNILRLSEDFAIQTTLAQEEILETLDGAELTKSDESSNNVRHISVTTNEEVSASEHYMRRFDNEADLPFLERMGAEDARLLLIYILRPNVEATFNTMIEVMLNFMLGDNFVNKSPAKAYLLKLIDFSKISKVEEEKLINFFMLFPYVKNMCTQYEEAKQRDQISSALFPQIKTLANKNDFVGSHLALTAKDKELLARALNMSANINAENTLDLIILLAHRYQFYPEKVNTQDNVEGSAAICRQILSTAALVEAFLTQEFMYSTEASASSWFSRFSNNKDAAILKARQQAFALAFNNPDELKTIARNSLALNARYNTVKHTAQHEQHKAHHTFTVEDLVKLRKLDEGIHFDDSASQVGDDNSSACTRTTVRAWKAMQYDEGIKRYKKLLYHKCLEHATKGKAAIDVKAIQQLTKDIQAHLTMLFTGISSVASEFVERGNTSYADDALDVFTALKGILPDPITRIVGSGIIAAGQFFLDYIELQRFLQMAKNLSTFAEMDIINQELTGLVVEYFADEFIELLNAEPDREAAYRILSGKITALLEAKVLMQLKNNDIESEAIHLGVALFEGLQADAPKLKAKQLMLACV